MPMQNIQNISWTSGVYGNIKKTGLQLDKIICYHYYQYIQVLYRSRLIYSSYALLFIILFFLFIEFKLTLIIFVENNCKF